MARSPPAPPGARDIGRTDHSRVEARRPFRAASAKARQKANKQGHQTSRTEGAASRRPLFQAFEDGKAYHDVQ